jgi:membrane protease YdiL (CAAX protease family)
MKFHVALEWTLAPIILRAFFSFIAPGIYESILGNALFFLVAFLIPLYWFKKNGFDFKGVIKKTTVEPRIIILVILLVLSLNLMCWVFIELEYFAERGSQEYFSKASEIFSWNKRQRFFVTILIIAPFVEEYLFRGVLLNELAKKYGERKSALFSTALFTLIHWKSNETLFTSLLSIFLFGLLLCYLFQKTGDIRITILAHILWNILAYLFPSIMHNFHVVLDSVESFVWFIFGVALFSVAVLAIAYYTLLRDSMRKRAE